jgi:hypothetical protein
MSLRPVLIRPLFSATPIPSIATSTVPSGAKPVKFSIVVSRIQCKPSREIRLIGTTADPSVGLTTETPSLLNSQDNTMSPAAKIANKVAGWGRALPIRSIAVRKRESSPTRGVVLFVCTMIPGPPIGFATAHSIPEDSTKDSRADENSW